MNKRQSRLPPTFAARSNRSTSNATPAQSSGIRKAQQRYAHYLELARTEARSGNTISAENYYQHAEHYFRMMAESVY
jgi:predicted solute-binding protein